jgi:glycine betaine/choline ABC-type transport system substrate-binding protein
MNPDLPDYARSRAILIGASAYQDKGFLPLPAAANSLKGLQEILVDQQLCGWPADRVTVLPDPADVRRLVTSLRRWARDTDEVFLLYFVGHGVIAPRGELCLAVADTEFADPDITGIEYERVRSALLDSPARIKVVILDCCYSGRAIQALSHPGDIADITDVRGVYTITASDQAAHVAPHAQQAGACTSFTGELLDLIRTGIPGGPDTLTLNMIYSHLRTRLRSCRLPAPNQRGTDTAGEFGFTRNAALLPQPIDRFPRPQKPPAARPAWHGRAAAAAAAVTLAMAAALITLNLAGRPGTTPCSTAQPAPSSTASGGVVVGADNFPEDCVLGEIYAQALETIGITITREFGISSREVYYPEVESGEITVVPEYNGALLTTSVDPHSTAVTTENIDKELTAKLPPWLGILNASPAQDMDSVTVTQATAARYHLRSIADLKRVKDLVIGGPAEFQGREQGLAGLKSKYGLKASFLILDDSGPQTIAALKSGRVQAADIFTTTPGINANGFVRLEDPKHVFTEGNVVPLVYTPGVNTAIIRTLNAVSAKLTTAGLRNLDTEINNGESLATAARAWLKQAGLNHRPRQEQACGSRLAALARSEVAADTELLVRRPEMPAAKTAPQFAGCQNSVADVDLVLYAARSYSLMRPPSRSRRSTRTFAHRTGGRGRAAGGSCCSALCRRWVL